MSLIYKYTLQISYVGTLYCGWQKQKTALRQGIEPETGMLPSIQSTIESTLERITGETLTVVGSGRTDAGVHALGQDAHIVLRKKEWDPVILQRALNGLLPESIRVLAIRRVDPTFHAQHSALKKQYSYYFQQGPCPLPHLTPLSWWIRKDLDLNAMQQALDFLKGEHDFKPFEASGAKPHSTVRTILEAEITKGSGPSFEGDRATALTSPYVAPDLPFNLVRVRLVGTGFLKQMVRGIAGTLLQVGEGRRPPECFRDILHTRNRSLVGPTAPARALWLERVWYT